MSLIFTDLPQYDLSGAGGTECRWNSLYNPYTFKATRRDYDVIEVIDLLTTTRRLRLINSPAKHYSSSLALGDTIYINSNQYKGTGTVVSILSSGGTLIVDVTGLTARGSSYTGYCNVSTRENYRVEVRILDGQGLEISSARYVNDKEGILRATIQAQIVLDLKNESEYDLINYADPNLSKDFTFQYREIDSLQTDGWNGLGNTYYGVNGAKQLGDIYDSNYADYHPYETSQSPKMKFLTLFERPKYFTGWPFDISFIFSERLASSSVKTREDELTINEAAVLSYEAPLDQTYQNNKPVAGAINRLRLRESYGATVDSINLRLRTTVAALIPGYTSVPTTLVLGGGEHILSETKGIDIDLKCYDHPIYLCWLNRLGGWDYWLFHTEYEDKLEVSGGKMHSPPIRDLSQDSSGDYHKKVEAGTLKIGADSLTTQQKEGLAGLPGSLKVYRLYEDGTRETVRVKPGSYHILDASDNRHNIEVKIILNNKFNQSL